MKKNKIMKVVATLGLALSLATTSIAPAYAAPRYDSVSISYKNTNVSSLFAGLFSRLICNRFGHTYGKGEEVKAPTYREEGVAKFTCIFCGFTKEEAIDKLVCEDHDWVEVELVECTGAGGEHGYWKDECSICGEVSEGIIHSYSYEHRELVKEGSETEHAIYAYPCEICGEVEEWEEHEYDFDNPVVVKEATETECATLKFFCKLCDDSYEEVTHEFDSVNIPATEEQDGLYEYKCLHCGYSIYSEVDHYFDYNNTKVLLEATEGQDGIEELKCLNCDEICERPIHYFDYENKELVDGPGEYTCAEYKVKCMNCEVEENCFDYHEYETEYTESNEEHDGTGKCYCVKCGTVTSEWTNHYLDSNSRVVIEEANGAHGIEEYSCKNCGEKIQLPLCDFDFENAVRVDDEYEGGCGKSIAKCKYCESTYTYSNHDFEYVYEKATEEADGYGASVCTKCGAVAYRYPVHWIDYENVVIIEEAAPGKHELVEGKCIHCDYTDRWEKHVYDHENPEIIKPGDDSECNTYRIHCLGCEEAYEYTGLHDIQTYEIPASTANAHRELVTGCVKCGFTGSGMIIHEYDYDNVVLVSEDENGVKTYRAFCSVPECEEYEEYTEE